MPSALLVGATGLIGGFVLENLLASTRYEQVFVIARREIELTHHKLQLIQAELQSINAIEFPAINDVYCCLGTTIKTAGSKAAFRAVDYDYVMAIAKLSLTTGATQFLSVSSMGAAADSNVFYNQVKGETEVALQAMPWPSLQLFRPSLLLGPRQEFRFGERLGQPLACAFSPLLLGAARRYRPIQAADVASKMVEIAALDLPGQHIHYFHDR